MPSREQRAGEMGCCMPKPVKITTEPDRAYFPPQRVSIGEWKGVAASFADRRKSKDLTGHELQQIYGVSLYVCRPDLIACFYSGEQLGTTHVESKKCDSLSALDCQLLSGKRTSRYTYTQDDDDSAERTDERWVECADNHAFTTAAWPASTAHSTCEASESEHALSIVRHCR